MVLVHLLTNTFYFERKIKMSFLLQENVVFFASLQFCKQGQAWKGGKGVEEEGRRKLKKRILKMYGTQAGFAEKLGIRKKSHVTDLLSGKREFGEDTVRE